MTQQLLNTLYVQTPDAYLHLEGDTLKVEVDHVCLRQIPLHHLGALVIFGNAMISPHAMHRCVNEGREITFLDQFGRFRCRVEGPVHGNSQPCPGMVAPSLRGGWGLKPART